MENVKILDGGFGTESIKLSKLNISGHKLWSTRLLKEDPELVKKIHLSFLESGSNIIETNTYQANINLFMKHYEISFDDAVNLIQESVKCAQSAILEINKSSKKSKEYFIAGSVGPYGAFLPAYAEYTGDYVNNILIEELIEWHRPLVSALVSAGVDHISFDTFPALLEVQAVCSLMREFPNTSATVCLSSRDGEHTAHGETLSDVALLLGNYEQITGLGVNCAIHPTLVSPALQKMSAAINSCKCKPKTLIAMPNRGEIWSEEKGFFYAEPGGHNVSFGSYAREWIVEGGARWIGGCCRVSPEDIQDLASAVRSLSCRDV